MATTDRTFYDLRRLHRVFAGCSVALLIVTIWLVVADHRRPWKQLQRTGDRIEATLARWRELELATAAAGERERCEDQLRELRSQGLPAELLEGLRAEVESDAVRRRAAAPRWTELDAALARLTSAAAAAQAARDAWQAARLDVDQARLDLEDAAEQPPPAALAARYDAAQQQAAQALQSRRQAEEAVLPARDTVWGLLDRLLDDARFHQELAQRQRQHEQTGQDVAKSRFDLAVRDGRPLTVLQNLEAEMHERQGRLDQLSRELEVATRHWERLQTLLEQLRAPEVELQKKLELLEADTRRLQTLADEKRSTFITFRGWLPLPGKRWLELPILDAFNSPRKITNLWCEGLDQPLGSFGRVRRFDRCVTCHTAMATPLPDAPHAPRLGPPQTLELALDIPAPSPTTLAAPALAPVTEAATAAAQLLDACGLQLAPEGLLDPHDVTVMLVRPESPAARARPWRDVGAEALGADVRDHALDTPRDEPGVPPVPGLRMGDVLVAVEGRPVPSDATGRQWVTEELVAAVEQRTDGGQADPLPPIRVTVRRGLPHPYAGHPRLDLFVGPDSPHPMQSFGCTVCHEGQGSATAFTWAAHTPNDPDTRQQWAASYGWSPNPDWDFPMLPQRFTESRCLRCHHQPLALEPQPRFPDPPAPKLLAGYHLIRRLGCFGCHEIDGYDDNGRQVAPDLRLEPDQYVPHAAGDARDAEGRPPGTLRKVGPSLRHLAAKVDRTFLVDWISDPLHFRPDTTMPRAFGLWNHLPEQGKRDESEARRESVAIYSVARYLEQRSVPYTWADPPPGVTQVTTPDEQQAQIARGRIAFEEAGCLVCHNHADFPDFARYRDPDAVHLGPDLTRTALKFAPSRNPHGTRWLYDWIQDPARYDPRTTMPSMQLVPVEQRDADDRVVAVTDPVADIVAYLMSYRSEGWTPAEEAVAAADEHLTPERLAALDELTRIYLRDVTSPANADQIAQQGIPAASKEQWRGPEQELVVETEDGQELSEEEWTRRRLLYVARRTLLANGCYACHDIPGMEDAQPIGPTLTGWGRKSPTELAFGHVLQYVEQQEGDAQADSGARTRPPYYLDELRAESRIGFIFQKLTEPRSFDYLETDLKKYTARLHMPQFNLTPDEREAIATFVLGLVSDPPSPRFTYRPDPQTAARIAGQDLLHTFQCRGCHVLEAETWELAFPPDTFGPQRQMPPHPFVPLGVDERTLTASATVDRRGWRRAVLQGMPKLADDGRAEILDALGDELAQLEDETFPLDELVYSFQLWRPAALDGWPYQVEESALAIETRHVERRRGPVGGALARYLLPHLVDRDRAINPNVRGSQAWTWLPPPLLGEGAKVQPDWLHRFLRDPQPIRPAVAMRMPDYHLSSTEAQTLVDYFAARDGVADPYPDLPERTERHLAAAAAAYAARLAAAEADRETAAENPGEAGRTCLEDAMRVVGSSDYCIKCHQVGSFDPAGWNRVKAPNLADVYQRLRPDYLRTWLAHPAALLPYTPMPVNIPYDPTRPLLGSTMSQDLYCGDTLEQLQGLVDLLLNFDRYAIERTNVQP